MRRSGSCHSQYAEMEDSSDCIDFVREKILSHLSYPSLTCTTLNPGMHRESTSACHIRSKRQIDGSRRQAAPKSLGKFDKIQNIEWKASKLFYYTTFVSTSISSHPKSKNTSLSSIPALPASFSSSHPSRDLHKLTDTRNTVHNHINHIRTRRRHIGIRRHAHSDGLLCGTTLPTCGIQK